MENVQVFGPVQIEGDSKQRVALELLRIIEPTEKCVKDRKYFLTLYRECLLIV